MSQADAAVVQLPDDERPTKWYNIQADLPEPLPPPKDTVQVLYTFATGGRTYYLEYDRYPGDPDRASDFDRMVMETLAFSA